MKRTNESAFARTYKQPARWSRRRRGVATIKPGVRKSLDYFKWLEPVTRLLGPVIDEQSHCVREDGSFFGGVFKLTNADGHTIQGRYFGKLEPTFNSIFPPPAPEGPWLINGNVCISGGSAGDIDNDCAVHRYEPARGITNLSTGDATIFLDQTIKID